MNVRWLPSTPREPTAPHPAEVPGMAIPDPYGRSTFHGKLLDNATIAALKIAEEKLGYELTILQGIGGAVASAGTHLDGRAVDLAAWDHARKVRVLSNVGFSIWYRPELPGVWGEHCHGILIFESRQNQKGLSPAGFRQIAAFDALRNGLVSNLPDANTYRPSPRAVFTLAEYERSFAVPRPPSTRVTRARDRLVEAQGALQQAAALLNDTSDKRPGAHAQVKPIRQLVQAIDEVLDKTPAR